MKQNYRKFREFRTPFSRATSAKIRACMAQFVLKIDRLSHIIANAWIPPEVELAYTYGLRS